MVAVLAGEDVMLVPLEVGPLAPGPSRRRWASGQEAGLRGVDRAEAIDPVPFEVRTVMIGPSARTTTTEWRSQSVSRIAIAWTCCLRRALTALPESRPTVSSRQYGKPLQERLDLRS
jgi:hypothetical protein